MKSTRSINFSCVFFNLLPFDNSSSLKTIHLFAALQAIDLKLYSLYLYGVCKKCTGYKSYCLLPNFFIYIVVNSFCKTFVSYLSFKAYASMKVMHVWQTSVFLKPDWYALKTTSELSKPVFTARISNGLLRLQYLGYQTGRN